MPVIFPESFGDDVTRKRGWGLTGR